MKRIALIYFTLFLLVKNAVAQCETMVTLETGRGPRCVLLYPDTALFTTIKEGSFMHHIIPKPGILEYGAYVVFDARKKQITMSFFTDTNKNVSGMVMWFNKINGKEIHYELASALPNGTYSAAMTEQHSFPMKMFSISKERYDAANRNIIEEYKSPNK